MTLEDAFAEWADESLAIANETTTALFDFDAIPDLGLTDDEAQAFIEAVDE